MNKLSELNIAYHVGSAGCYTQSACQNLKDLKDFTKTRSNVGGAEALVRTPLNTRTLISVGYESILKCRESLTAFVQETLNAPWSTWFQIGRLNIVLCIGSVMLIDFMQSKELTVSSPASTALDCHNPIPPSPFLGDFLKRLIMTTVLSYAGVLASLTTAAVLERKLPAHILKISALLLTTFLAIDLGENALALLIILPMWTITLMPVFALSCFGTIFYLGFARKLLCDNQDAQRLEQSKVLSFLQDRFNYMLAALYVFGQGDLIFNTMIEQNALTEKALFGILLHLYDAGMKFLAYYVMGHLLLGNDQVWRDTVWNRLPLLSNDEAEVEDTSDDATWSEESFDEFKSGVTKSYSNMSLSGVEEDIALTSLGDINVNETRIKAILSGIYVDKYRKELGISSHGHGVVRSHLNEDSEVVFSDELLALV